jgi:hypothetical protein
MCRQEKDSKQEKLNTTTQEGMKKHQGHLRLAGAIRRVKQGSHLKNQADIQDTFQKPARLSGMTVPPFCLPLSSGGTETPNPSSMTEVTDLLSFLQEEQSLQPFDQ